MVMLHGEELKDNNGIALRAGNYYSIRPKVFAGTVSFLDGAGYIYNPGFGSHLITIGAREKQLERNLYIG